MQLSLSEPSFPALAKLAVRFGRWWLGEFLALLPERIVELLSSRPRPLLVITTGAQDIAFEFLDGSCPSSPAHKTPSKTPSKTIMTDVDRLLVSRGLDRQDVDIGLRLPPDTVFTRRLMLPMEAQDSLNDIIARDLATRTPFKAEDILHDLTITEHAADEKIEVCQWIVRREFVLGALSPLELAVDDISFIVFGDCGGAHPVPFIYLRREARAGGAWERRMWTIMCFTALFLASIAGGLKYWNQQSMLDRLDAQIATISKEAQRVRAVVDQVKEQRSALFRLRLRKSEAPGAIDLWEETTRMLPPDSWLTEFRLNEGVGRGEQQVTLIGYSAAAPRLVGVIDASHLLFDAALISPIAFDPAEGRERFALQAKVRLPDLLMEAAR